MLNKIGQEVWTPMIETPPEEGRYILINRQRRVDTNEQAKKNRHLWRGQER